MFGLPRPLGTTQQVGGGGARSEMMMGGVTFSSDNCSRGPGDLVVTFRGVVNALMVAIDVGDCRRRSRSHQLVLAGDQLDTRARPFNQKVVGISSKWRLSPGVAR